MLQLLAGAMTTPAITRFSDDSKWNQKSRRLYWLAFEAALPVLLVFEDRLQCGPIGTMVEEDNIGIQEK
jgi:hypothetical protein